MGDHRNQTTAKFSRPVTVYGPSYVDVDPVMERSRKEEKVSRLGDKKKKKKKEPGGEATMKPSMNTRLNLSVREPAPVGEKYKPPVSKQFKMITEEKRRELEKDRNFCKFNVTRLPSKDKEETAKKSEIRLEAPSAEIQEDSKVAPRKASITGSQLHPDPQDEKDLTEHSPKSGTIINIKKKRRVRRVVKKKPPPEPTIEELIAQELATIKEMGEGEEEQEEELLPPENYLTKQLRKKVKQLSKTTSISSKDFKPAEEEKVEDEEAEEEEEEEEEEQMYVDALTQKFRRDSEIKRYERPKRKTKKGTFENFSFTRLKQPTLKSFYYGIKMATVHQGDEHFPVVSRNRQGICMPIAAYCFSILKHPDKWTQADIDEVLEAGNELFLDSAGSQHMHGDDIEVKIQNLQKYCKIGTKKIRFVVSEPEVSGMVRSDDKKIYNITKGVNVFFGRYSAGILQTENLCIALWKDKHYYFFDASPRTLDLYSNPYGTALMANFYDITSIVSVLLNRSNLENVPFTIYSIKAYKVLKRDAEEVESTEVIKESDNYQVLDEQKAVAQGSFDLADKCFGFSRNKQALTISAVALVYSKITPPSSWHRGTVDKIVIIGNQLFLECIENDEIEEVSLDDLPAVFTIGPYVVEIYISPNRFVDFMKKKSRNMLQERLEKFFETNSNAIVQIDNSTLAIWKQRNVYHCFDPYSRNKEGLKCRDGAACISMHTTLNSLIETVSSNFDGKDMIFRIHAMKVCKIHRDPSKNDLFPRSQTMNDYPIENFKKFKMRKGKKKATTKAVTVDPETRAAVYSELPEGSILEVGSTVKSIGMEDLPPMCHKTPSVILKSLPPPEKDFVADLDSPSLSDTQIEPPLPEEPEGEVEIEFQDLDGFDLTQEELELTQRGEGGEGGGEGGEGGESSPTKKRKKPEDEEMAEDMEKEEGGEGGGDDDWYIAVSQFSQVGSHSLMSTVSKELNTEMPDIEVPEEEVPPLTRDIAAIIKKKKLGQEAEKYQYDMSPDEEVDMWQEYMKESNFVTLPDNSQVVMGSQNIASFGDNIEVMAPFICIMATAVAKKYAIDSWSKDIVDYVLKCGAELYKNSNTRFDQNYKLEIAKISLGSTDFSIKVDYVFDTYIKSRVLSMALGKMLFPNCPSGIVVTPTYSCAVFVKNQLYYLFDGFGNNEVGLSKGPGNEGVACFSRFTTIDHLVARILHNKGKREQEENIEYNRFVLSSCYVKNLPREKTEPSPDDDEQLADQAEDGGETREEKPPVRTYPKQKSEEPEKKKKPPKRGYHKTDDGLYKIEGTKVLGGEGEASEDLKQDYFACLCACLHLLNNPLKTWDEEKVDSVLDQGVYIFQHAEDIDVCSKKYIKNVLVDEYLFDIVTSRFKFVSYQARRTFKTGIETMLARKHEHFIIQFPNRSYTISVDGGTYHLFDPNDKGGKASWTRYKDFKKLVKRIQAGLESGSESYNFHSFEIMSIAKAPKSVVLGQRSRKYRILKEKRPESPGKPFHEEVFWLDVEPIPWSWKTDKRSRDTWNNWYVEFPDDLYSLFGTLSPLDDVFPEETRGKQTLGNLVVVIGMTQVYELCDWNSAVLDSVLLSGDMYFQQCIKDISNENYEVAFDDLKEKCVIFPYRFEVQLTPVVEGTMFLVRPKQFNLYKALRLFFDDYERRFGIVCVTKNDNNKRICAFGKTQESEYFLYDCETLGPPMYVERDVGVPYMLRTTTLNRLLHVMTLTLRGGDFYIFDLSMTDFESLAA